MPPCGTPVTRGRDADKAEPIRTLWVLLSRMTWTSLLLSHPNHKELTLLGTNPHLVCRRQKKGPRSKCQSSIRPPYFSSTLFAWPIGRSWLIFQTWTHVGCLEVVYVCLQTAWVDGRLLFPIPYWQPSSSWWACNFSFLFGLPFMDWDHDSLLPLVWEATIYDWSVVDSSQWGCQDVESLK